MKKIRNIFKQKSVVEEIKTFLSAVLIALSVFGGGTAYVALAAVDTETLQVQVMSSITFATDYYNFANLTPGTPVFATTTLAVTTNDADGWNVKLSGDDQGDSNTVMDLTTDATVGLTDQDEMNSVGLATTTALATPTSVRIGSLDNSGDVLAFRVATASSTDQTGQPFWSTTWWGTSQIQADDANSLWAGIGSSTNAQIIGNAGAGSYAAATHKNSVMYYLDVPATQQTGTYTGGVTYTATVN